MTLVTAITRDDLVTRVGENIAERVVGSEMKVGDLASSIWPDKTPKAARRKLERAIRGSSIQLEDLADFARVFGVSPWELLL